jgi:hypothetical protein
LVGVCGAPLFTGIADNLLNRAKVVAGERRTTLCELAVAGLVKVLESNHGQYYDGVNVINPFV